MTERYEFMFSDIRQEFCAYKIITGEDGKESRFLVATGNEARELKRKMMQSTLEGA